MRLVTALVVVMTTGLVLPVNAESVRYSVAQLVSGEYNVISSISETGFMAGQLEEDGQVQACAWIGDLFYLLGPGAALDVNDIGAICGESWEASERRAAIWRDGQMTVLGTVQSGANAVNNCNTVVGWSMSYAWWGSFSRPMLWQGSKARLLSAEMGWASDIADPTEYILRVRSLERQYVLPSGLVLATTSAEASARTVDKRALVVGTTYRQTANGHQPFATAWAPRGNEIVLGSGYAEGVSRDGSHIVGYCVGPKGKYQACQWNPRTKTCSLYQSLYAGFASWANAVNSEGVAVGYCELPSGSYAALMFTPTKTVDLNEIVNLPKWQLWCAEGINDRGQIVCRGWHRQTGRSGAFLLTPVMYD